MSISEQQTIRDVAYEEAVARCEQDTGALHDIVAAWIDGMTTQEQLQSISDDPEILYEILGFTPSLRSHGVV